MQPARVLLARAKRERVSPGRQLHFPVLFGGVFVQRARQKDLPPSAKNTSFFSFFPLFMGGIPSSPVTPPKKFALSANQRRALPMKNGKKKAAASPLCLGLGPNRRHLNQKGGARREPFARGRHERRYQKRGRTGGRRLSESAAHPAAPAKNRGKRGVCQSKERRCLIPQPPTLEDGDPFVKGTARCLPRLAARRSPRPPRW